MAEQEKNQWDFLERYLPNYYRSQSVCDHDDLSKILDNEYASEDDEESICERIIREDYEGNPKHPQIQIDADALELDILREAVSDFMNDGEPKFINAMKALNAFVKSFNSENEADNIGLKQQYLDGLKALEGYNEAYLK